MARNVGYKRMVLITQSMTPGTVLWFCVFAFRNRENGHIFLKNRSIEMALICLLWLQTTDTKT